MIVQGSRPFSAPSAKIFDALLDPLILQQAIPGCEKLEKTGEDEYRAHLKIGIASLKGNYSGNVRLGNKQRPDRFTLYLEGKGAHGFVKGSAQVVLKQELQTTNLEYTADVQVGGLIAAVGSRMVEAAAKKLADDFFQKFSQALERKP